MTNPSPALDHGNRVRERPTAREAAAVEGAYDETVGSDIESALVATPGRIEGPHGAVRALGINRTRCGSHAQAEDQLARIPAVSRDHGRLR